MNKDLVEYVFKGFIAVVLSLSIYIFSGFEGSIERIQESVSKLNISFALFSERLVTQKENYIQITDRVKRMEALLTSTISTRWTRADHKEYAKEVKKMLDEIKLNVK